MNHCPRPGCNGSLILDRDVDKRHAEWCCMSCARRTPVVARPPLPLAHEGKWRVGKKEAR